MSELHEALDLAVTLCMEPVATLQALIDQIRAHGISDSLARRATIYLLDRGDLEILPGRRGVVAVRSRRDE